MAQGDGEISGTAIEASLNVTLQFVLHKDFHLRTQLLVTPTHWMVHAYHEDLNKAMYQAALEMLDFLTTHKGLSAEDAYALMSVAADFTVTQVVDQRQRKAEQQELAEWRRQACSNTGVLLSADRRGHQPAGQAEGAGDKTDAGGTMQDRHRHRDLPAIDLQMR
jgi:hypothetical protein